MFLKQLDLIPSFGVFFRSKFWDLKKYLFPFLWRGICACQLSQYSTSLARTLAELLKILYLLPDVERLYFLACLAKTVSILHPGLTFARPPMYPVANANCLLRQRLRDLNVLGFIPSWMKNCYWKTACVFLEEEIHSHLLRSTKPFILVRR